MNYRDAVLLPSKSVTAAAVETLALKGLKPISEIVLIFRYTNNGSTPTEHPAKILKSLKVVDGSESMIDLTGFEAQALDFYHNGRAPLNVLTYIDNNIGTLIVRIPFGRWLWDSALAFAPENFSNPQMIIDHDLSLGGSAPDAMTLEVILRSFDGKVVNPIGYLRSRRHYTWSLVSSGVETIDLPTDLPIKMMILQSIARTKPPNGQFSNLKISEDLDQKVVMDNGVSDLVKILQEDFPEYAERMLSSVTTSQVAHYTTPCYEEYANPVPILDGEATHEAIPQYGGKVNIEGGAASEAASMVHGFCPHGALAVRFGDPWDYDDWYALGSGHSLKALVTGGSSILSSSTAQIILQQLKKY